MDSKTYISLATKTESVPTELKINQTMLHASLTLAIAAGNVIDQVKRRLFYGKPLEIESVGPHLQTLLTMSNYIGSMLDSVEKEADKETSEPNQPLSQELMDSMGLDSQIANMNLANLNIRLLHAALGGFTENGEKLEALLKQYETGVLDLVNFAEENGDAQWYNAIEIDELGKQAVAAGLPAVDFTERGLRIKNITKLQGNAKLKGRYADGDFDAVAALNRDLTNERAILESSTTHLNASLKNVAHLEKSVEQLQAGEAVAVVVGADGNFQRAA